MKWHKQQNEYHHHQQASSSLRIEVKKRGWEEKNRNGNQNVFWVVVVVIHPYTCMCVLYRQLVLSYTMVTNQRQRQWQNCIYFKIQEFKNFVMVYDIEWLNFECVCVCMHVYLTVNCWILIFNFVSEYLISDIRWEKKNKSTDHKFCKEKTTKAIVCVYSF